MERERGKSQTDVPALGQLPPACCAICNSSFQLAFSRLLKPGGCSGFRSLMIRTLSAAHRASLRRIVENSGSSAYAKSSAAVAPTSGSGSAMGGGRTGDQRHSFVEVKIAGHVYSLGRRRIAAGPSVAHPAVALYWLSFAAGLP